MALELQGIQTGSEVQERFLVGAEPRKKLYVIRIDAPLSRQPLVKGERLVRFEVSAAMLPQCLAPGLGYIIAATPLIRPQHFSTIAELQKQLPHRAVAPIQR